MKRRSDLLQRKILTGILVLLCTGMLFAVGAQAEEQIAQTEGQTVQAEEQIAQTEEQTIQTEGQTVQTEERTAQTEVPTAQTEEQIAQTEGQTVQTEEQTAQTEPQSAQTEQTGETRLSRTKLSVKTGRTKQLELYGATGEITWKSSKRTVATVSGSGTVKAKKAGTCVVTAACGGKKYSCTVTVRASKKQRISEKLRKSHKAESNQGKIVVAGSSTIARWVSAPVVFDPDKVLNMGIGGSIVKEWLQWYKKLIVDYHPSAVVLFPGTGNQLNRGYSEEETASDACRLLKKLHAKLPNIPIFYVSNYRTMNDAGIWQYEKSCNEQVEKFCSELDDVYYIDVTGALTNEGKPKPGIIAPDGGHMNDKGYKIWNSLIVPRVQKRVKKSGK